MPNSSAFSRLIRTNAAAPSLIPEAFPAVTVPSFLNAGFNFANLSAVTPERGNSSLSNMIGSPLRCGMTTGTISALNLPS